MRQPSMEQGADAEQLMSDAEITDAEQLMLSEDPPEPNSQVFFNDYRNVLTGTEHCT